MTLNPIPAITETLSCEQILARAGTLIDVRSPMEFSKGHIPGAVNYPLFSNEERHQLGLTYRIEGPKSAVALGLAMVGPRLSELATLGAALDYPVSLYCARGGQRSHSVAWLWSQMGNSVSVLNGGYRAFRSWCAEIFERPQRYQLLGGLTGAGKTEYLHERAQLGEQIIDLERIAGNKGSAFGAIGECAAPSQQLFENTLALELSTLDPEQPTWVEDESRRIGRCLIPAQFWQQLQRSPLYILDCPTAERIQRLCRDYSDATEEELLMALGRIRKKLGAERFTLAQAAARTQDHPRLVEVVLAYYDKAYTRSLLKRTISGHIRR